MGVLVIFFEMVVELVDSDEVVFVTGSAASVAIKQVLTPRVRILRGCQGVMSPLFLHVG
jgi:hypothetical protein